MKRLLFVSILCVLPGSAMAATEKGIVAHYSFDEGQGAVAKDLSGNGNDGAVKGGARWVAGAWGTALEFDGKDDYVDCGTRDSLNIATGGTLMIWCRPRTLQGGLISWSTGVQWVDKRLVLGMNTYSGGPEPIFAFSDGVSCDDAYCGGDLKANEWAHLAITFDGEAACAYRDGIRTNTLGGAKVRIAGIPLWLGKTQGLGQDYFHGCLDEVRIYNRVLSPAEVLAIYKREAVGRGHDVALFRRAGLEARAYPEPGKVVAGLDVRRLLPLPADSRIVVGLSRPGARETLRHTAITDIPDAGITEAILDVRGLAPGTFTLRANIIGPDGSRVADESETEVRCPERAGEFRNIKILNNLCWELLNVRGDDTIGAQQSFSVPINRWVFIRSTADVPGGAEVRITIEGDPTPLPAIVQSAAGDAEGMRFLRAGKHLLRIERKGDARIRHLLVRAIPALQHAFYGADPHVSSFGPYDWDFLKRDVLSNVNVIISATTKVSPYIEEWKKIGRNWIAIQNIGSLRRDAVTAEEAYDHWTKSIGLQHPLMDGVIVDEFGRGRSPMYDAFRHSVERIYADPKFKGKAFLPYCPALYYDDRSSEFGRACVKGGGYMCWEVYLSDRPDARAAQDLIRRRLSDEMPRWEACFSDAARKIVLVLGCFSEPYESLNSDPTVNYKTFLDMQIRHLATHPAFFGLGGIQEYHSAYASEETVRWIGKLYRHYALEGNTETLSGDPYKLTHIRNPDFEDGLAGWTVSPAEEGAIQVKKHVGYRRLEGRAGRGDAGDPFLWMKRSAARPNGFSQQIGHLTPGRLYSMRMITADYQNLVREISEARTSAVSIQIENAQMVRGPRNSFQSDFPNSYSVTLGKFNRDHPFRMNYHWHVFRAKGATAKLTVSDWETDAKPSGPVGQELLFSWVKVQPYFGSSEVP